MIQSRNSQDNVPKSNNKKNKKIDSKKSIRQQLSKIQKCMNTSEVSEFYKNDSMKIDNVDCSSTINHMDIIDVSRDLRLGKKRGRKTRFPLRLLPSLKKFILSDSVKGNSIEEIKNKFESEMKDDNLIELKLSYWTYYKVICGKDYLNMSFKRIKNYCLNKILDPDTRIEKYEYTKALMYYIDIGYTIYYLDETSINLNIKPRYGYGIKGKAIRLDWISPKSKNYTFVGIISNEELLDFTIIEGGMKGTDFYYFLLKTIEKFNLFNKKVIFVADNLYCHKLKEIYLKVKDRINMLFLPRNCPILNPIEYLFSYIKNKLRKYRYEELDILMLELNMILRTLDAELLMRIETHVFKLMRDFLNNRLEEF